MPDRWRPDQEFYESIIESSPLVVVRIARADLSVRYISPNISRLFGLAAETVMSRGWSWLDVVHPGDVEAARASFATFLTDTKVPMTSYFRIRTAEGVSRWMVARFRDDPSGQGDLFGFLLDIHDRVVADAEANRQRDLLQSVLDHASVSVQVKDLEGRFLVANRRIHEDLDLEPGSLTGKTVHEVWPPELADAYAENDRAAIEAGEPITVEELAEHADGMHTYVSIKFPLRGTDGKIFAVGGVSTDITDRRLADEALREAKAEAERANRAKSEFLSRMSHELKTPLNSILGFAQLLELDDLPAAQVESVDQILKGGRHLLELIDEVLDISRIESGAMDLSLEPVPLDLMIQECLDLVGPQANARGIELANRNGRHRHVMADRQRLRQVLLNLLSNAVKFNREGGTVTVAAEHRDADVTVLVTDTGPGIRPEMLGRLFTPFDRLEAEATGVPGTGLGLAISRRLVEAMGGTLGVSSTPGEGSTFSVDLPAVSDAP